LCLLEQGDQTTIWEMHNDGRMLGIAQTFRKQLSGGIRTRLTLSTKRDTMKKRIWMNREERFGLTSRGNLSN
jgi:hypothetical protein